MSVYLTEKPTPKQDYPQDSPMEVLRRLSAPVVAVTQVRQRYTDMYWVGHPEPETLGLLATYDSFSLELCSAKLFKREPNDVVHRVSGEAKVWQAGWSELYGEAALILHSMQDYVAGKDKGISQIEDCREAPFADLQAQFSEANGRFRNVGHVVAFSFV